METPDQYVHRAMKSDLPVAGRECGWKPDSTVSASSYPPGAAAPDPAELMPARPHCRSPLNPLRGLLPSRPPGEAGGGSLMRHDAITPNLQSQP